MVNGEMNQWGNKWIKEWMTDWMNEWIIIFKNSLIIHKEKTK